MLDLSQFNYEVDPEITAYDPEFGLEPKEETYYIVYNKIEFSIIAQKIGFKDKFISIVESCSGNCEGGKDEFTEITDVERTISKLKTFFSNENNLLLLLARVIITEFPDPSEYDENILEYLKKKYYMFYEEVIVDAITYMVNNDLSEETDDSGLLVEEETETPQEVRLCIRCGKHDVDEDKQNFNYIDGEENFCMAKVNPICDYCIEELKERDGEAGEKELYFEPEEKEV